ncbi:zinc finger MYM-type protein 1-like protein [Tanacetum coccineum]
MKKKRTIDSFYKPIKYVVLEGETQAETQMQNQTNGDDIMEESPAARVQPATNTTLNSDGVRKPIGRAGSDTFTTKGFNNWRKVNSGKDCPFVNHEGKTPASAHNFSVRCYEDLKNKVCHIENVIDKQTEQEIMDNRLRVKVTIDATKWLTLQTCPLRGGDERPTSINRGNYLELVKLLALYNKDVARVVLENAPQNAKYTSPDIQKELLQMFAMKVQEAIRDEIGTAKFCLIVDESKKEQMAIVVRFVDQNGYIKERFLDLVHVKDTNALTLKNEILASLSHLKLDV